MKTITEMTVRELSAALERREISAAEAAQACFRQIQTREGRIHAFLTVTEEGGMAQAERADQMRAAGKEVSPLCGIPYAVKDNFAVAGYPMTCASGILRDFIPPYTATVCERAEKAGSVLLGKTNLDEFAMGSSTEKSIGGATVNPLDETRSAGGSSGGSAAAVASGEAFWTLGSDTGGSGRQPAAFCGLVAMKPTYGLLSRYGMTEFASSLDTVCPITKDVADNAGILSVLAGQDPRDMTSLASHEDFSAGLDGGVRGLRIGMAALSGSVCSDRMKKAVQRTAALLEDMGAAVEETELPFSRHALEAYLVISSAEMSSNLARFDGIRYGTAGNGDRAEERMRDTRSANLGEEVRRRMLMGHYALLTDFGRTHYEAVCRVREAICRRTEALWGQYDAILMPTVADEAFWLGSYDSNPTSLYESDRFTVLANLTGCPAITLPVRDGGLPLGVTLMGKKRSESLLYRCAFALEKGLESTTKEACR